MSLNLAHLTLPAKGHREHIYHTHSIVESNNPDQEGLHPSPSSPGFYDLTNWPVNFNTGEGFHPLP